MNKMRRDILEFHNNLTKHARQMTMESNQEVTWQLLEPSKAESLGIEQFNCLKV